MCVCVCVTSPPRRIKEDYAKGITSLFPYLAAPMSKLGYVCGRYLKCLHSDECCMFHECCMHNISPAIHNLSVSVICPKEQYYNAEDGSGYLAWRIKTLPKEASEGRPKRSRQSQTGAFFDLGHCLYQLDPGIILGSNEHTVWSCVLFVRI